MRFLIDECAGPAVAQALRSQGHEVFSVYDGARGISDDDILQKAFSEDWILISTDKDFGEKIYREKKPHKGIVLLRLSDERSTVKIELLRRLLESYSDRLEGQFVVVTEKSVRFARAQI
jgi:predicted nuclease of predicted toxin-antitoxin system